LGTLELPASVNETAGSELREGVLAGLVRGQLAIESFDSRCALDDQQCTREAAGAAGIEFLVEGRIDWRDPDYRLELEVVSVSGDRVAGTNATCEICGSSELVELVTDEAAALVPRIERLEEQPAFLVVEGRPRGATVRLDGEVVGSLPYRGKVAPGPHTVEVEEAGFVTARKQVELSSGLDESMSLALARAPATPRERQGQRRRAALGWGLLAGGIAGLGAGATLLVLEGRPHEPTCPESSLDISGACPNVYTTQVAGIATLSGGLALAAAGTALLLVSKRRTRVAAQLHPRGFTVTASF
jgi:hypothetical protein